MRLTHALPSHPTTGTEMYLAALLAEVQALRAELASQSPQERASAPGVDDADASSRAAKRAPAATGKPARKGSA